jgi:hypothetical protein
MEVFVLQLQIPLLIVDIPQVGNVLTYNKLPNTSVYSDYQNVIFFEDSPQALGNKSVMHDNHVVVNKH